MVKKINKWNILSYLLIAVFIALFAYLSISRHESLKSFQNDLGTYAQITWNNLHGHFFESSGSSPAVTLEKDFTTVENFNYLGAHFSPLLLFLVPFYAVWPDPRILLILQAFLVGIGSLPIYWLAKEKIKVRWGGLLFLISFLFYPILHNALLYDFHEVVLGVPLVSFALWFWYKKKTASLLIFLALLLIVQEHISLIVFMMGLYMAFFQKRWKLGLGIAVVSLLYFLTVVFLIIPSFSPSGESTLIKTEIVDTRYAWLGGSLSEIINNIIHKPFWILKNMLSAKRIDFLVTLLLPLFGLPLFSALSFLSLPILAIYFLSSYWLTYSIHFYHSSILAGIFYFAAIFAFTRLFREIKWQRFFLILILFSSLMVSYIYSATPFGRNYYFKDYLPSKNARLVKEVQKLIPKDASLSVQHNLGPHFTNHRKLFHFPFDLYQVDYVIVDVYNPFAINPKTFYSISDVTEVDYKSYKMALERLLISPDFGVIYTKDGWLIFQRGADWKLNEQAIEDYLIARDRLEAGFTSKDL